MASESIFAFSICPRITADEESLTAATSVFARICSLGLWLRRVVVDRNACTVTVTQRAAWFFRREQVIPFAQIVGVTYGYDDVNPVAGMSSNHDALDRFIVGLCLTGRDELPLFFFLGDGFYTNDGPLPDWWYWEEYTVDFVGGQERESQLYVQLLSKMIGVTITPSTLTRE